MANTIPNELLNPNNPMNLAVASSLTFIITNTLAYVFAWKAKWIGLLIAIIISLAASLISSEPIKTPLVTGIIFILFNGFIIYASAVGLSVITKQPKRQRSEHKFKAGQTSAINKTFFNRWW